MAGGALRLGENRKGEECRGRDGDNATGALDDGVTIPTVMLPSLLLLLLPPLLLPADDWDAPLTPFHPLAFQSGFSISKSSHSLDAHDASDAVPESLSSPSTDPSSAPPTAPPPTRPPALTAPPFLSSQPPAPSPVLPCIASAAAGPPAASGGGRRGAAAGRANSAVRCSALSSGGASRGKSSVSWGS